MMALSWQAVVRLTWLPNVIIVLLMVWLIATNQGLVGSIDRDNLQRLQQLEEHGTSVARDNQTRLERIEKQFADYRRDIEEYRVKRERERERERKNRDGT